MEEEDRDQTGAPRFCGASVLEKSHINKECVYGKANKQRKKLLRR